MWILCLSLLAQAAQSSGSPAGVVDPSLAAPVALDVRACGNEVELRWQDVSSAETGFVVLRRDLPALPFQELAVVGAGVTEYVDSAVANGVHVYAVATRGTYRGLERTSPPSARVRAKLPNLPPALSTDLGSDLSNDFSDTFTFHVTATDPEGDPVSVRLLNPQHGMVFEPAIDAPSPATIEVRWRRDGDYRLQELPVRLVFESDCGARLEHDVRPARVNNGGAPFLAGDVTGDGILDAVAIGGSPLPSPLASVFVFAGSATPSGAYTARLQSAGEELLVARHGLQCADLDGDGTLDIVIQGSSGSIHLWKGGPAMSGTPSASASLQGGGAGTFDLVDLDGDGLLDVVLSSPSSSVGAASFAGRLFLWYGAGGYSGARAADRVLTAPAPATNDLLGDQTLFADVTGDGELEILARAHQGVFVWDTVQLAAGVLTPRAILTPGSSELSFREVRVGELSGDGVLDILRDNHIWRGGPALNGIVSATSTLAGQAGVELSTVALADWNADGRLDALMTGALGFNGQTSTGGFYLWAGGGPTGTVAPTATLSVPGAVNFDNLANALIVDLDQDGIVDVLAHSIYVDGPGVDAGAMYAWYGTAGWSGTTAPDARLGLGSVTLGSQLTFYGIHVDDLDGDGELDVLAAAPWNGPGAVHVYRGSGRFAGNELPDLSLTYVNGTVPRIQALADVSGDGQVDLVLGTSSGRILIWNGGPTLLTATVPSAILTGPAQLGLTELLCFDLDEDGERDIVADVPTADLAVVDAGWIGIWRGGAGLAGTQAADVILDVANARAGDNLGSGGLRLADWTGDGRLDLLAITSSADSSNGANVDSGALYLWNGTGLTSGAVPVSLTHALTQNFLGAR